MSERIIVLNDAQIRMGFAQEFPGYTIVRSEPIPFTVVYPRLDQTAPRNRVDLLMAFARRMQAVGVRSVESEAKKEAGNPGNTGDYQCACRYLREWCEAEAKRLEGL